MAKSKKISIKRIELKVGKVVKQINASDIKSATSNDTDFRCIDGILHILVCIGGQCKWVPLDESC